VPGVLLAVVAQVGDLVGERALLGVDDARQVRRLHPPAGRADHVLAREVVDREHEHDVFGLLGGVTDELGDRTRVDPHRRVRRDDRADRRPVVVEHRRLTDRAKRVVIRLVRMPKPRGVGAGVLLVEVIDVDVEVAAGDAVMRAALERVLHRLVAEVRRRRREDRAGLAGVLVQQRREPRVVGRAEVHHLGVHRAAVTLRRGGRRCGRRRLVVRMRPLVRGRHRSS
jgi:hypothetical protein